MQSRITTLDELRRSSARQWWNRWGMIIGGILLPILVALALTAYIMPGW